MGRNIQPSQSKARKPWLTPSQQVEHLKAKGVRFELMSEGDAVAYLKKNSNYFRLRSYRTGFPKVEEGKRKGEYVKLDFKMLVDLSIIDMLLRRSFLPLAIDVEHFAKVALLNRIEAAGEDGYTIVSDFIESSESIKQEIERGRTSVYVAGLLDKYKDFEFPAWVFMEVISFGTFCHFYKFCACRFDDQDMKQRYYQLMDVKSFRNACAHNNCILNDLGTNHPRRTTSRVITQALGRVEGIGASQRRAKMRNPRLRQIVTVLFVHKELASEGVKAHEAESLASFKKRMNKHLDYYKGVDSVTSTFSFLSHIIESWYPLPEKTSSDLEIDAQTE